MPTLNTRKAIRKLSKHYNEKLNMPKKVAKTKAKKRVKEKVAELIHYEELHNFLEEKKINNILFCFVNSKGEKKERAFDLKNNKSLEDFQGVINLVLTNKPENENEINYSKLRLTDFHITCASMSKVFEEDKIDEVDYMLTVCLTSFLNSLLNDKMPTLKAFKNEVNKIK